MARTLLASFAHPDDETFLAGPVLAKYAAEGVRIELICATPPDGQSSGPYARRRNAALCAAEILGIRRVTFLGYADSTMRATQPHVPGQLSAAPLNEVTARVAAVIDEVRPEVVITDSQYGAYGHPDHIVMHRATAAAFQAAGKPGAKLYALAYPLSLVRLNMRLMPLVRVDPRSLGALGDIDLVEAVRTAPRKSALVGVAEYVSARREAARCYEVEIANAPLPLRALERAPLFVQRAIFGRAAFTRILARGEHHSKTLDGPAGEPPDRAERLEDDLFRGVP